VEPGEKYNFAWDEPFKGEKVITLEVEGKMRNINPNEIGQLLPLTVRDPESGQRKNLSLSVLAQGPKIIILITLFDSKTSYYKSRESLPSTKESVTDEAAFEEKSVSSALSTVFTLKLPFIGFSFIQMNGEELVYLSARAVEFRYTQSEVHTTLGLSIGWLQLDNQSFDWQIPIIFYPTDVQKQVDSNEVLPFIKLAIIKHNTEEYGLNCYRYFGFLMQECSLDISEEILAKLLGFVPKLAMGANLPLYTTEDVMPPRIETSLMDTPSYFEVFQLHPIKANFSFSKTESIEKKQGFAVYNPFTAALEIIMMTIGQVSDANLRYNALVLENVVINRGTLLKLVIQNYRNETLGQLHRLIGSADVIGNPAGLFQNFSTGVTDLFYEPYQGFVSDRPQDFGLGLAKGTASLIRHTIYGISDSFAKLTGTFGRGFAAATLDKSYQRKRRIDRARNKPRHALEGLASGTLQFITGVTSGVAGLVEKPVELAKKEGATGFFKGVGLGLVGIVTKPLVGVMDMTTTFTEGIRGSADSGEIELLPARLPRAIPFDGVLQPYEQYEAEGQSILLSSIGKRRKEKYVAHLARMGGDDVGSCLMLTTRKILLIRLGSKRIVWAINLSLLQKMSKQGQNTLIIDDGEGQRIILLAEERLDWFFERYNILTISNKRIPKSKAKK
jgi:vacuolar protein sorting-associated protein 13A/C